MSKEEVQTKDSDLDVGYSLLEPEKRSEITPAEAQRMTENEIGTRVIEAAIAVHRELRPGLLETVYEVALARELADKTSEKKS